MGVPGPNTSLVGKTLDERYELLEIIGTGGVGVVYRARHLGLERMVAVKVLHEQLVEDAGFVGRFKREAVAMSRLYHPHCVGVIDSGVYDSQPYLVLEYLPGATITKLLGLGPFVPERAVNIALQLLETLEYFHSHHVIHRDLKSENVMLVESSGTSDFVKVLDFGMAKILTGPGADSQLSKIGVVPGTPSVMAPEQIYQLPPDPRIDIYATGILLYEMIVGRRPFRGDNMAAVVKMQISTPPKRPREVLGDDALSTELDDIIIKALEKDRIDRFGTAAEMAAALRLTPEGRAAAPAPTDPRPAPTTAPPRRGAGRSMLFMLLLIAVAGAAVIKLRPELLPHAVAAVVLPEKPPPPKPRAIAPAVPPPPPVAPVVTEVPSWTTHRDRAVSYANLGLRDDANSSIHSAVDVVRGAAIAHPAFLQSAVDVLGAEQVAFVTESFRANPKLVAALLAATANGKTLELRHAALDALTALDERAGADLIAMYILDVEQAPNCSIMRDAFDELRKSKDPRVRAFKSDLRSRGRRDRHVRCLKRVLKR